jgi:hypothetical protein
LMDSWFGTLMVGRMIYRLADGLMQNEVAYHRV